MNVMEWPVKSPDLNPIEILWADVKIAVAVTKPTSNQALLNVVKESWNKIPLKPYQELVNLMPRRCNAVIDSKGHETKFFNDDYLQHKLIFIIKCLN